MKTPDGTVDCSTMVGFYPKATKDLSVDALLHAMDRNGVAKALTISTRGAFFDYAEGNDETLRVTDEHEQLIPVATLDPRGALDFRDEIKRMIDRGVRIFRLFPEHQGWSVKYLPFKLCIEQLSEYNVVLMMSHVGEGHYADLLSVLEHTAFPVVITSAAYSQVREVVFAMKANDRIHVGTRLLSSPTMLGMLRDEVGLERLLFESGAPMFYMESAIGIVAHSNLEEHEKSQVFGANCARLIEE